MSSVLVLPTHYAVGTLGSGAAGSVTGTKDGTGNINAISNAPDGTKYWWVTWSGFVLPRFSSDTVINHIYGVATCANVGGTSNIYFGTSGDFTYGYPGSPTSIPAGYTRLTTSGGDYASTQFTTSDLGTDLALITSGQPYARSYIYLAGYSNQFTVSQIAYLIDYTGTILSEDEPMGFVTC